MRRMYLRRRIMDISLNACRQNPCDDIKTNALSVWICSLFYEHAEFLLTHVPPIFFSVPSIFQIASFFPKAPRNR